MQSRTELRPSNETLTFMRSPPGKITIAKALGIEEVRVPKARKIIKIAKTAQSSNPIEAYKEGIKSCKKRDTEKLHS